MNNIIITDANGKEFNINISKNICYLNDDLSSDINQIFTTTDEAINITPINLQIVNSKGEVFSITDENVVNEIVDIDVYIEATHSDREINSAFYTSDSMLRDAVSYTAPYKKPFILNHDTGTSPVGRIVEADCIDSAVVDGVKAVNVVAKVSDKDAISKFLDGRYSTVSIGANPKSITCNHCGKHILKDGKFKFCGHFRGESYDDKKCTWKMEDLEYSELSIVNCPADRHAQVYKIKVNTKADLMANNSSIDSGVASIVNSIKTAEQVIADNTDNENAQNTEDVTIEVPKKCENCTSLEEKFNLLNEENAILQEKINVLTVDNETLVNEINTVANEFKESVELVLSNCEIEKNEDFTENLTQFKKVINNINATVESNVEINPEMISMTVSSKTSITPAIDPSLKNDDNNVIVVDNENEPKKGNIKNEDAMNALLELY